MYYCYLLRCADNSLYCGITNDLKKRVAEHNSISSHAAKYTRSRQPVKLVYFEKCNNKETALKREIQIKKLEKSQKEELIVLSGHSIR